MTQNENEIARQDAGLFFLLGWQYYLFSASFRALAGVNASFLAAATLIVAPVAGLRASRSGVSLT
jgi:hypothetical protein